MTVTPALMATPACRPPGLRIAPAEQAGDKVAALLRLPPEWYPPTVVVPVDSYGEWRARAGEESYLEQVLPDESLWGALEHVRVARSEDFIVRSSAVGETIAQRGRYASVVAAPSAAAVRLAVHEIWRDAAAQDGAPGENHIAVAIQPNLVSFATGHMSNEHRVCRDSTSWMVEGLSPAGTPTQWRVSGATPATESPLRCAEASALRRQLRSVARWFAEQPYRHHLEWVWDGERLWIVQCDRVPVEVGESPGELWRPTRGRAVPVDKLQCWRQVDAMAREPERWVKLECRRTFARAGLPVVDVFALSDAAIVGALAEGELCDELRADLELLCDGHLIVRTDVAGGPQTFMLPKTEAEIDPEVVARWMQIVARSLRDEGAAVGDIVFIAHRFLRSRTCAWSYARPGEPVVRVDSVWGLNDGLSWLPHDTALVDVDSGEVTRTILGKPTFLDVEGDHHWRYRDTPTEWIWRASATEDQARVIGRGARRLATRLGQPVITMWFVGLLDGADSDCLPWYQATWDTTTIDEGHPPPRESAKRYVVASRADLEAVPATVMSGQVLQLRPDEELIRDKNFVDRVAAIALERDLLVEIEGSPLAHPYYMLRRSGVPVYCRTPIRAPASEEVPYNKLVRDRVPVLIAEHGEHAIVYRVDEFELPGRLRAKAVEEALELMAAETRAEKVGELADLYEVLEAFIDASSLTIDEVRATQQQKRRRRGSFQEGLVLVATGDNADPAPTDVESEPLPGMPQPPLLRALIKRDAGGLEASLIPPARGERAVYAVRLGDRVAEVSYTDSTVRLRLQPVVSDQPSEFEQPDLWS